MCVKNVYLESASVQATVLSFARMLTQKKKKVFVFQKKILEIFFSIYLLFGASFMLEPLDKQSIIEQSNCYRFHYGRLPSPR